MSHLYAILSLPRSGSNFVSAIIREHDEINLQIEPFNQYFKFAVDRDWEIWDKETFSFQTFHKDVCQGTHEFYYLKNFRKWANTSHFPVVRVFKETIFSLKLNWLLYYLPDIRYVFLVRSSRDVVNSLLKGDLIAKWHWREKLSQLSLDGRVSLASNKIADLTDGEVGAYMWRFGTENMLQFYKAHPHSITWISYDQMVLRSQIGFTQLLNVFGKSLTERVKQEIVDRTSIDRGSIYATYRAPRSGLVVDGPDQDKIDAICKETYKECLSYCLY